MLNSVCLVGRAGDQPTLKYLPNGTAVANVSMAVQRDFKNKDGEKEVDWVDIVIWRKSAEYLANHLAKGKLFSVEGRLQVRYYETNEGQRRKVTEVVANSVDILEYEEDGQGGGQSMDSDISVLF